MVEVEYISRLGNNLFQYCFGRILAEKLGYRLKADPILGFPNTNTNVEGLDYSSYPTQVIKGQVDLSDILQDNTKRKIIIKGYFQRYDYYRDYKNVIKTNWLLMNKQVNERIEPDDIVVCIRRKDYLPRHALPFSYFDEALSIAEHSRVFICTDSPRDSFTLYFKKKYKAIIYHKDILADFAFIMLFKKIIISNSSFFWWASFLSNADEIYFPIPLHGFWSEERDDINLKVDESRYIYIRCKDAYKEGKLEKGMRLIKPKLKIIYRPDTMIKNSLIYLKESVKFRKIRPQDFNLWSLVKFFPVWLWNMYSIRETLMIGDRPRFTFQATHFLTSVVNNKMRVYEYGTGESTLFFARYVKEVIAVDCNSIILYKVKDAIIEKGYLNSRINLIHPKYDCTYFGRNFWEPDLYLSVLKDYSGQTFEEYAKSIEKYPDGYFDIISINKPVQFACLRQAIKKLNEGGYIVLDDVNEAEYSWIDKIFDNYNWRKIIFYGASPLRSYFKSTYLWKKIRKL